MQTILYTYPLQFYLQIDRTGARLGNKRTSITFAHKMFLFIASKSLEIIAKSVKPQCNSGALVSA